MVDKVADIKGMDPAAQQKLEAAGIKTTQQFLQQTGTAQQRNRHGMPEVVRIVASAVG